jgi:Mce-associated membrane protein
VSDDPEPAASAVDEADLTQPLSETTAPASNNRSGLVAAVLMTAVLAGLGGWLGFRYDQSHAEQQDRALFLQVGRQAAVNLTTIDNTRVDADVQRILDSSTGTFHDDFQNRAQPFIAVVKQVKSTTEGTVTEAGLETAQNDGAQVLVAVSVKTSNAGAEQELRAWRMRISVQKSGSSAKVSNVEFVP